MVSACFERAGFSLYGRDWIGRVPGGTLNSKSMHSSPVWTRKYIYFYICVFCESRAESIDSAKVPTGSAQCKVYPGSSSVLEAKENIRIDSRADIEVRGVSSGESSVALES